MNNLFAFTTAAFTVLASQSLAQTFQTAMSELTIVDPSGDRDLGGLMWYPTIDAAPETTDFESKVWVSTPVIKDAEPAIGPFPLIVLSHGMFGNSYNQAWFAGAMARKGYVVAAINHPGTSTWLRDPDQRRALWERPKDITRVIDFAMTDPDLMSRIDSNRIFMAGHSLGGFTAVALAGGQYDASALNSFCAQAPDELTCGILNRWEIAKTDTDRVQMEADLSDQRITAFAVFDLGGTQSFSTGSLAQIDRPMLVFGAPIMNSGLTLDIVSRALVDVLPSERTKYIEPETLSHFDFLGQCKPGGFALLEREEPGDEIICVDGGAARAAKHAMIIEAVDSLFSNALTMP
jgi:predicted dienelactone hydrolase